MWLCFFFYVRARNMEVCCLRSMQAMRRAGEKPPLPDCAGCPQESAVYAVFFLPPRDLLSDQEKKDRGVSCLLGQMRTVFFVTISRFAERESVCCAF